MIEIIECARDDLRIYKYHPTVIKPFYINMEPLTIMRRFRFWLDLYFGYSVYYLKKGDEYIGYCTITSGKNPRYWFATDKDIIVGPYYIDEKYRGNGYSTYLVDMVINRCEKGWKCAYDYILNTNFPSIHVTERLGGKLIDYVHVTPLLRRLKKIENGEYGVFRISENNLL